MIHLPRSAFVSRKLYSRSGNYEDASLAYGKSLEALPEQPIVLSNRAAAQYKRMAFVGVSVSYGEFMLALQCRCCFSDHTSFERFWGTETLVQPTVMPRRPERAASLRWR